MKNKVPITKVIFVSLILVLLGSYAYTFYQDYLRDKQAEEARIAYEEAIKNAKPTEEPTPSPSQTPTPLDELPSPTPKAVRQEFLELRKKYNNEDIVGFLKIEGTSIDYPVLQAKDNEYYLRRDMQGDYYIGGSIFLDYENDVSKEDSNTIIYGHNMKADKLFHSLRYYADKEYYEKHKYITFNTIYEDQTFEVFSFMKTDTNFSYITVKFPNLKHFAAMLDEIKRRGMYDTGVEVTENDRILSLSTCADVNSPYRFVVSAKLIKPEDSKVTPE